MPLRAPPFGYNDLIRRSIDLRRSYRQAAAACEPGLRMVLGENVQTLDQLIADLQWQVAESGGKPRLRGSRLAAMKHQTADLLVRVAARSDLAWLHTLARHESALLHAFESAMAMATPVVALTLQRQLSRLQNIHLDMHNLGGIARS